MNKTVKITLLSAAILVLVLILVGSAYAYGRSRGPFNHNFMTYDRGWELSQGSSCPRDDHDNEDYHGFDMFEDMHGEMPYFHHMDHDPWHMRNH